MSFPSQRLSFSDSELSSENDHSVGGRNKSEPTDGDGHGGFSPPGRLQTKENMHLSVPPKKRGAVRYTSGMSDDSAENEGFSPPMKTAKTELGSPVYPGMSFYSSDNSENEELSSPTRPQFGHMGAGLGLAYQEVEPVQTPHLSSVEPDSKVQGNSKAKPNYNLVAAKMMAKMGYKEGEGLGKNKQGRVNIVESSKQRGRRGLGFTIAKLDAEDIEWDFNKDEIIMEEAVEWLPPCEEPVPDLNTLQDWKLIGPKKETIDDETDYCTERTLKDVLENKSVFDHLESEEMRRARTRSNPYETIRGAFFQNRAAMKMANMDAVLDFMFTKPVAQNGKSLVDHNELLYFADVCAGPGGFSEYVLWRIKGESKGFGMTLKNANDFKLEEFYAGPSEMFEPHYGVGGAEGDGDIYNPDNQREFKKFVLQNTDGKGVHFVMADGGFSVEGKENIQEILSKQLYLCQFLVALSILRTNGHFVCKLFDLFTPFSVGLVYLMYRVFHQISIFKPVTSRPANSERYIVCKWCREDRGPVVEYMEELNRDLNKYGLMTSEKDVREIVSADLMADNEEFFNYLYLSNEKLARLQVRNLKKIQAFAQNMELYEKRQKEVRDDCLKKWKVPDEVRKSPTRASAENKFKQLMKGSVAECVTTLESLTTSTLPKIHSVYDYRCMVSCDRQRMLILGVAKGQAYKFCIGQKNSQWQRMEADTGTTNCRIELPVDTLLEAEVCQEFKGEGRAQRRITTIHALDAYFLMGVDVQNLPFQERVEKLRKFAKAIHKTTKPKLSAVKVPEVFRFEEIKNIFNRLMMKQVKSSGGKERLCFCANDGVYFYPAGIHFIKFVKDPWFIAFSRTQKRKYFYNAVSHESVNHCPVDSVPTARECKKRSLYWTWEDEEVKVHERQTTTPLQDRVSKEDIFRFVHKKLNPQR